MFLYILIIEACCEACKLFQFGKAPGFGKPPRFEGVGTLGIGGGYPPGLMPGLLTDGGVGCGITLTPGPDTGATESIGGTPGIGAVTVRRGSSLTPNVTVGAGVGIIPGPPPPTGDGRSTGGMPGVGTVIGGIG